QEPTKIDQALDDESWVEAMQEELLQFKIQKVWTLVNLPYGKKAIGTKIEAIMLFLAYASFMNFLVYQMDVKSAFLYGTIEEKTIDSSEDIIFGSTKKSLCADFKQIMHKRFQMSSMGELTFFLGLQVKQKEDGIFISQDKYVGKILKKFGFSSIRTASTPMETNKALTKDEDGKDIDVHLYRSMIRCQLGQEIHNKRLSISWFKVANSTTKAEYIAASHCCGQVLWIQNQMLNYGFNFMQTKIHVDNESAICVVKNPVSRSKTKHIEIRNHFIRGSYEKRLIKMVKIHTDNNVADLLTKAFDVSIFYFLVASIGKRGRDTKIPQSGGPPIKVGDEVVHKELGDRMERAATTASSFEAEQDSDAQTRFETVSIKSNDPPLSRVNTLRSGEDSIKLMELMAYCTKLFELDSAKLKTVNGNVQIQALIDGKKIIVNEESIRRDLKLYDAEGSPCLPNATIFEELTRIGAKTTA
ncbi:retrovirus-related pol polyprotein from transposon TNT 1-94, partial [Tanacetum coccineum]